MSVIIIIKHVEWIRFIPGSWNNMTQRQEIQLGQVPRSIVMAGEDQVGEHGDDRTRNEHKCVDYSCPASRCGDNPTSFVSGARHHPTVIRYPSPVTSPSCVVTGRTDMPGEPGAG